MHSVSRREFLKVLANGFLVTSLFDLTLSSRAEATKISPEIARWMREVHELSNQLREGKALPSEWQVKMEHQLASLDLVGFLRLIDFERLAKQSRLPDRGESFEAFSFPSIPGIKGRLAFYRDVAGFRKSRSIPPHGHDNLVSAFLVLRGELHGRHFSRQRDEGDTCVITPTIDRVFHPGEFSTVSQARDNVHWFTAQSEGAFIFDFGVGGLDPHWQPRGLSPEQIERWKREAATRPATQSSRVYLDIASAEKHGTEWRAQRLSQRDAYAKYG